MAFQSTPSLIGLAFLTTIVSSAAIRQDGLPGTMTLPLFLTETEFGRGYRLQGAASRAKFKPSHVRFNLDMDPTISFNTYFGGSNDDMVTGIAVDSAGNIYIAGWTASTDLPAQSGAVQRMHGGSVDAFVAKLDPTASKVLYCTYLGGRYDDRATSIAVDAAGSAYVTGSTSSPTFPVTGQTSLHGSRDAFVAKLSPAGDRLVFSVLLGGSGDDSGNGIAVNSTGNAFVVGNTNSWDFPTAWPTQSAPGGQYDAFVAELNSTGASLLFGTYLGGMGDDSAAALALDPAGNVYVTGATGSPNFPLVRARQTLLGGIQDAFVTKLDPAGRTVIYTTYLGGTHAGTPEFGSAIDVDASGNAYVTGTTNSTDFTVQNAFQPTFKYWNAAYLSKFDPMGNLVFSTYLGGASDNAAGYAVRVNAAGGACVAGQTSSRTFPLSGALRSDFGGIYEAFLSCFTPTGSALSFSTFLGGGETDSAYALALSDSSIYVAGMTASRDFQLRSPVQTWNGGAFGGFVVKVTKPDATGGAKADFDHNTVSDLLLQDDTSRTFQFVFMGGTYGTTPLSRSAWFGAGAALGWRIAAVADFNGDGSPDLIWQRDSDGLATIWFMTGPQGIDLLYWTWLDTSGALQGWRIRGAADFNCDGKPDLVWQNSTTRAANVWLLGGVKGIDVIGSSWITSSPAPGWRIVAIADFNRDGFQDIVWQEDTQRTATVWFLGGTNGTTVLNWAWLSTSADGIGWTIRGAADFNRDGMPDIIWQNDGSRSQATVWFLGGTLGTDLLGWTWLGGSVSNVTIVAPR